MIISLEFGNLLKLYTEMLVKDFEGFFLGELAEFEVFYYC